MNIREKALQFAESDSVIDLTRRLVQIKSCAPDFNEKEVALEIAKELDSCGISWKLDELNHKRANIIAETGKGSRPHLMLCGHMDTVPSLEEGWTYDPFSAHVEDGIMHGRGTSDMKGGDAALVTAMCCLKKAGWEAPGKLSFLGTMGEESDCVGAKLYMEKYGSEDIDAMIVAEASAGEIYVTQRGALWLRFKTKGRTVHPGVAWLGVNALEHMLDFIEKLRRFDFPVKNHPILGKPTLNIDVMHAGEIVNAIPDSCICEVDIRTVPGIKNADIIAYVESLIGEFKASVPEFDMEYEVLMKDVPTEVDQNSAICRAAFKASEETFGYTMKTAGTFFGTDSQSMARKDGSLPDFIIYGPGNPERNHKLNEFIELQAFKDSVKFYINTILNYFEEA